MDVRSTETSRIQHSLCVLRVDRDRAMGRSHHLQDPAQFSFPTRHEEQDPQLCAHLRNGVGGVHVLLSRHGKGSSHAAHQMELVVRRIALFSGHLVLRRGETVFVEEKSRWMGGV